MRKQTRKLTMMTVGLAALITAAAAAAATVVVAPSQTHGWTAVNDTCGAATTGSVSFVTGPGSPSAGAGSLRYTVGSNGDSYPTVRTGNLNGVKLSTLSSLDYSTYVSQSGSGGQAPYIDLYIDNDNNGTRDDILTFEPIYNPSQGSVTLNMWQHWNALTGLWWSDNMGGPPPLFTLASYLSNHPNARILPSGGSFILAAGCGGAAWTNFVGNADKLTIGVSGTNTTYDFEASAPVTQPSGHGHAGSHGHTGKVTVCHNGHTISISRNALPAHLRIGDHVGSCP